MICINLNFHKRNWNSLEFPQFSILVKSITEVKNQPHCLISLSEDETWKKMKIEKYVKQTELLDRMTKKLQ